MPSPFEPARNRRCLSHAANLGVPPAQQSRLHRRRYSKNRLAGRRRPRFSRSVDPSHWRLKRSRRGNGAATGSSGGAGKKMARLECGPAKKKVQTFRGEHRPAEWEESPNDFAFLNDFSGLRDEFCSKQCEKSEISYFVCSARHGRSRFGEYPRSGAAPRRDASAAGFSAHWRRRPGTTDCPDRLPGRALRQPVPPAG